MKDGLITVHGLRLCSKIIISIFWSEDAVLGSGHLLNWLLINIINYRKVFTYRLFTVPRLFFDWAPTLTDSHLGFRCTESRLGRDINSTYRRGMVWEEMSFSVNGLLSLPSDAAVKSSVISFQWYWGSLAPNKPWLQLHENMWWYVDALIGHQTCKGRHQFSSDSFYSVISKILGHLFHYLYLEFFSSCRLASMDSSCL